MTLMGLQMIFRKKTFLLRFFFKLQSMNVEVANYERLRWECDCLKVPYIFIPLKKRLKIILPVALAHYKSCGN